jgi:hypothetical protein
MALCRIRAPEATGLAAHALYAETQLLQQKEWSEYRHFSDMIN